MISSYDSYDFRMISCDTYHWHDHRPIFNLVEHYEHYDHRIICHRPMCLFTLWVSCLCSLPSLPMHRLFGGLLFSAKFALVNWRSFEMYTMNICRAYQSKINLRVTVSGSSARRIRMPECRVLAADLAECSRLRPVSGET